MMGIHLSGIQIPTVNLKCLFQQQGVSFKNYLLDFKWRVLYPWSSHQLIFVGLKKYTWLLQQWISIFLKIAFHKGQFWMYSNILTSFKDCLCTPFEISKIFKYFVNRTRLVAWFTYVLHAYIYMLPKSVRITFYKHLIIFQTFMPIIYWFLVESHCTFIDSPANSHTLSYLL